MEVFEELFALVRPVYLGATSHRNHAREEVGNQPLQGERQAVDVHRVDQAQAALGRSGGDRHTTRSMSTLTYRFITRYIHPITVSGLNGQSKTLYWNLLSNTIRFIVFDVIFLIFS